MRVSVCGTGECHLQSWPLMAQKMAQLPFCTALHSPVSEDIRGALENKFRAKGNTDLGGAAQRQVPESQKKQSLQQLKAC